MSSLYLDVPDWPGHLAGQHIDVRLTADDGYQTERSYSIASAPEERRLAMTIERLDDGEVSPYLVGELKVGDKLELRGPIGGYFVWSATETRPLLLIGAGCSGRRPEGISHADAREAGGLGRFHQAAGRGDVENGGMAALRDARDLRLRTDVFRGGGGFPAGRAGLRAGLDQDREIRGDRRLR